MTAVAVAPELPGGTMVVVRGPRTRVQAKDTLAEMRRIVRAQVIQPIVWETARAIVAKVTPRDEGYQAQTIRSWCAKRWRFINDSRWYQNLAGGSPVYCLTRIREQGYVQGNCAGAAMLSAALCEAIHIACRFISVAFNDVAEPYSHVFTVAYPKVPGGRAAVEMDFTRPDAVRRAQFSRRLIANV